MSEWPGLAYVLEHGLPGYPPPRIVTRVETVPVDQTEKRRAYWKVWAAKNRPSKRQTLDAGEL